MSVSLAPFYVEFAAIHDDVTMPARTTCHRCCHRRGAGTCAASHRDATAALPHSGAYHSGSRDLSELYVASLRESGVALHYLAVARYVYRIDVVDESDEMRVAHRNKRACKLSAVSFERCRRLEGELFVILKHWRRHIHGDRVYRAVQHMEFQYLHPRLRLQSDGGLVGQSLIIDVFAYATAAVAAHHSLRTVSVIDVH